MMPCYAVGVCGCGCGQYVAREGACVMDVDGSRMADADRRNSYFCSKCNCTVSLSPTLSSPPSLVPYSPFVCLPFFSHSVILFYLSSIHSFAFARFALPTALIARSLSHSLAHSSHSLTLLTHSFSALTLLSRHIHPNKPTPMLRLTKSFPFFQAQEESLASTFIAPSNGYNISVPTRNGLDNYYGPGTVFQGQLNLQLLKPIKGPCRLRVILACTQTIGDVTITSSGEDPRTSSSSPRASQSSDSSSTGSHKHGQYPPPRTMFAVEHILLQDMAMAIKRHTFLFTVKFPMCNFPPSFQVWMRVLHHKHKTNQKS